MGIEVVCSGCSRKLTVSDEFAGKKGRCPFCKTALLIPEAVDVEGLLEEVSPEPAAAPPPPTPPPRPPSNVSAEQALAQELTPPTEAPAPRSSSTRWFIIGGVSLAVFLVAVALAWFVPQWLESISEPPPVRPGRHVEAEQPAAVEQPEQPAPAVEPAVEPPQEPVATPEPPAAEVPAAFALTEEVASRIPPNCTAYVEMLRPHASLKAAAAQRLWNDPERAEWLLRSGFEGLAAQVEKDFNIPRDVLAAAAAKVTSIHLCVIDWEPKPRWAVLLRFDQPPAPKELFGDAAESLRSTETYHGVDFYSLMVPESKQRISAACVENYAVFASQPTALQQVIRSIQEPPAEGPYARGAFASRPAFREALQARSESGDDVWAFVDVPRLLEQAAATGFDARLWLKVDAAVDLSDVVGAAGAMNLSETPAVSVDLYLKAPHPLLAALDGPAARPEPADFVPPNATCMVWANLTRPAEAWDAWRASIPDLMWAVFLSREGKRLELDHDAWLKLAAAIGPELRLFSTRVPVDAISLGLIADADGAALDAAVDAVLKLPAFEKMKLTQQAIGEIALKYPEGTDAFPSYAIVDGKAVLSNRREAVEQALQAHREKQPPATDGMPAAMERLGPDPSLLAMISAPVLVRDTRLGGQAMLLVKDDTWVAAGASVRPDHLAISLSDPVPLWPVLNWLGASAETTEQAHQLQCMENLRRLAMAAIVSVPIDELAPQTVYPFPTHVREVAEKGGIEDLSIFRCPSDRNPIDYGRGLLVSYEFIFQEVDFRIAVEPPFDYLLAWDKKGNHPGVRVVVFADGKAQVVPEERFQQLLADTKVRVQQHRQ